MKWLTIICEFTRECHTLHPERHLTALDVIDELMRLIELLNAESFANLSEAQALARIWKRQYNEQRPHSSLGYLTPAEFAAGQPDPPLGATPLAPGQAPLPKEQRTLIAAGAQKGEAQKHGPLWSDVGDAAHLVGVARDRCCARGLYAVRSAGVVKHRRRHLFNRFWWISVQD